MNVKLTAGQLGEIRVALVARIAHLNEQLAKHKRPLGQERVTVIGSIFSGPGLRANDADWSLLWEYQRDAIAALRAVGGPDLRTKGMP